MIDRAQQAYNKRQTQRLCGLVKSTSSGGKQLTNLLLNKKIIRNIFVSASSHTKFHI
jgi:hypothetical protein